MSTSTRKTPTSNHTDVRYNRFSNNVGKKCVIQNIDCEKQKEYIFIKCLQNELFFRIRNFICGWKAFIQKGVYQEI